MRLAPDGQAIDGRAGLSRRRFLARASAALAGFIGLLLGGTGVLYVLSPLFRKPREDWVDAGRAADFSPGRPAKIEFIVRRRDAWVTRERRGTAWVVTADRRDFIVFDPRCTHLGCAYRWDDARTQFLCPCHTAAFGADGSVRSGPPPRALDRYPWKLEGGRLKILPRPAAEQA